MCCALVSFQLMGKQCFLCKWKLLFYISYTYHVFKFQCVSPNNNILGIVKKQVQYDLTHLWTLLYGYNNCYQLLVKTKQYQLNFYLPLWHICYCYMLVIWHCYHHSCHHQQLHFDFDLHTEHKGTWFKTLDSNLIPVNKAHESNFSQRHC